MHASHCSILLLSGLLLVAGCGRGGDVEVNRGFPAGWARAGASRTFSSANLYAYINGGAEIFLEFGFDRLDMHQYTRAGMEIAVEIYRMTDAVAAAGVYLMKCGRETPDPSFSERHTVNDYQLLFHRGEAYVMISNPDGRKGTARTLLEFARRTAALLPGGDAAGLFDSLPAEGRIAGSERVVRGQFTLQSVYTLGEGDILQLGGKTTALAADYRNGKAGPFTLIVAGYADSARARAALENVKANLDSTLEITSRGETGIDFRDAAGKVGRVRVRGSCLEVTVNLEE